MRKTLFSLFSIIPVILGADEAIPYIERSLVPILHASFDWERIEGYTRREDLIKERTYTLYLEGGLSFAPYPFLNIDLSAQAFKTDKDPLALEAFTQTFKYMLLDDAMGDPFALSLSVSCSEVFSIALYNPVTFRKGLFEFEVRSAQGVESDFLPALSYRLFAMEGLGVTEAALWFKGAFGIEFLSDFGHRFGSKLIGSYGFGNHSLCLDHFRGYGPLAFRTIDYVLYYQRRTDEWIYYSIELLFRAYSKNAPAKNLRLEASIEF